MTNCNWCGTEIKFDGMVRSQSGKMIPLLPNGEKHDCPKNPYNTKSSTDFQRNKQMYAGPQQNQMEKDLADLGVWKDGAELRIQELEREANRFIELTDAIAKELKIRSFKTASELQEPIPDESTN